jgi:hypothetical protein
MGTMIGPTANLIAMDDRRPIQSMAAIFAALGYLARLGIGTVTDLMERSFAEFAGVPYQGPLSRQQWQEMWEAEAIPYENQYSV